MPKFLSPKIPEFVPPALPPPPPKPPEVRPRSRRRPRTGRRETLLTAGGIERASTTGDVLLRF